MVRCVCLCACLKFTLHVEKSVDGEKRKDSCKSGIRGLRKEVVGMM